MDLNRNIQRNIKEPIFPQAYFNPQNKEIKQRPSRMYQNWNLRNKLSFSRKPHKVQLAPPSEPRAAPRLLIPNRPEDSDQVCSRHAPSEEPKLADLYKSFNENPAQKESVLTTILSHLYQLDASTQNITEGKPQSRKFPNYKVHYRH